MNKPEYIIIHHSLTKDGKVVDFKAIKKYHIETNGWNDIGYHYVVERVGDKFVAIKGRKNLETGAHCKEQGMNNKSIGICMVGNYDKELPPHDLVVVLVKLIKDIQLAYKIPNENIRLHREYATYKSCPGWMITKELILKWLKEVK